ncbi:MAG TPA: phosphopentomutase [Terriglobales bacterium]|nr:phosphopentomutase [Terriglobales bacterium]
MGLPPQILKPSRPRFERVLLLVLDSVGIGAMPDAGRFGPSDAGSDTLGHVLAERPCRLPVLESLGLGHIRPLGGISASEPPRASFGKCALRSEGKDTTTGHWEMAGIILDPGFPTFLDGFPRDLIAAFERRIGRPTLGNLAASGTEIIQRLGPEHLRTGYPIVYTSADSVFQLAGHEAIIPLAQLYDMCAAARALLQGPWQVGRVIARPFVGDAQRGFQRTRNRHDFAVPPPQGMLLDQLATRGIPVHTVGKIFDIFLGRGIASHVSTRGNADGLEKTLLALEAFPQGLLFVNLVDFDMLYGHRNDVEGYARSLEEADSYLRRIVARLGPADLLILTADHGCDPTTESTDHTREFVPLLAYAPGVQAVDLGTRDSLADIGQTIAANFGFTLGAGESFLTQLQFAAAEPA